MDSRPVVQQYIDAINQSTSEFAIKSLLTDITELALNPDDLQRIYEALIKKDGKYIQFIGKNARKAGVSEDVFNHLCIEAVRQNFTALEYIQNENTRSMILYTLGNDFILAGLKTDGSLLRYIPKKIRNFEILLESITQNPESIMFLSKTPEKAGISEDEFYQLHVEAFKKEMYSIRHIQDENIRFEIFKRIDKEHYLDAVKSNGLLFKYIPPKYRTINLILESINQNASSFEFLGRNAQEAGLDEHNYLDLCLNSAMNNPLVLQYMDDHYKKLVINKLGLENLLFTNYNCVDFLPKEYLVEAVPLFLSQLEHVVVTDKALKDVEIEVKDAYLVYASLPVRQGKTIHIDQANLNRLLTAISHLGPNAKPLNLVLLDHARAGSSEMASLKPNNITNFLKQHKNIIRVTLLGCHTAKVKPLEQEKAMAKKYKDSLETSYSGFIVMSAQPTPEETKKFFDIMSTDKNGKKTNTFFVLINDKNTTYLLKLKRDDFGQISSSQFVLSLDAIKKLPSIVNRNKKIPTPSKGQSIIYHRAGKSAEFLSNLDTVKLMDTLNADQPRFTRGHPDYQSDKKDFPFLTSAHIGAAEEDKILSSFLKLVVDAVKAEPNIEQQVVVKGYTKAVHVDTKERQMKIADENIYIAGYKNTRDSTFFNEKKESIDRKSLETNQRYQMKEMSGEVTPPDTSSFKSVKWTKPGK